jgi:hypothetical protein
MEKFRCQLQIWVPPGRDSEQRKNVVEKEESFIAMTRNPRFTAETEYTKKFNANFWNPTNATKQPACPSHNFQFHSASLASGGKFCFLPWRRKLSSHGQ